MPKGPVVVCDPGVDDLLALFVLAGSGHPPSAVIGTAGNVELEQAYANAWGIVDLLGFECPVAKGAGRALRGPYPDVGDPVHGTDGLGGVGSALSIPPPDVEVPDAVSLIKGTVLATSPLTVVAAALEAGCAVSEIVWMGGAVGGGNMTASAEFNAWLDPAAADQVLSGGVPLAMVPLDVTHQVPFMASDLDRLGAYGRLPALAARACTHLCARESQFVPHDAVATMALLHPALFTWVERWVRCEVDGEWTTGMTVVDRRPFGARGSIRVAVGVDIAAVKEGIVEAVRAVGDAAAAPSSAPLRPADP